MFSIGIEYLHVTDIFSRVSASLCMIFLSITIRTVQKTWLHPAAIFVLIWTINCLLSFLAPEYPVWDGAFWWIFLTCLVLYIGTITPIPVTFSRGTFSLRNSYQHKSEIILSHTKEIMFAAFICNSLYLLISLLIGVDIKSSENIPLWLQLLLSSHLAGGILGGIFFKVLSEKNQSKWFTVAPIIMPLLQGILFTARNTLISSFIYWLAGFLAAEVLISKEKTKIFTKRRMLIASSGLLAIIFISTLLQILRENRSGALSFDSILDTISSIQTNDSLDTAWSQIKPNIVGQLFLFSNYFKAAWEHDPLPKIGSIIFTGPLSLISSFFNIEIDRYPFENIEIEPGIYSNVYTGFRAPIDDFTLLGSLIWWYLGGVFQGISYKKLILGNPVFSIFIAWWYIDAFFLGGFYFRYNSIILGYFLSITYMMFCVKKVAVDRGGKEEKS
jgi:hypothetical protein